MNGITKQEAQKFLSTVPNDKIYWCRDGRSISNLRELEGALATMDRDTYYFQSNPIRKTLSSWVQEAIGDQKLANDLLKTQDRADAFSAVQNRVDFLENAVSRLAPLHIALYPPMISWCSVLFKLNSCEIVILLRNIRILL